MQFGICPFSVVPVRSFPSHQGELHSQLLFGELFEIQEVKGKQWYKIATASDNVGGWIEQSQCKLITEAESVQYQKNFAFSLELVQAVMGPDHFVPVMIGSRFPNFDGLHFRLGDLVYTFSGQVLTPGEIKPSADFLLKIAKRYLGAPFLWGGRTPFGVDSSGLTQLVFQFIGIKLPRSAAAQIELGTTVDFIEHVQAGDLAFFENKIGRIAHVGIIMPGNRVIHANGSVRIDLLDHYGVYDEARGLYTRRLRLIKRLLPTEEKPVLPNRMEKEVLVNQVQLF